MTSNCDNNLKRNVKKYDRVSWYSYHILKSFVIYSGPLAVRTATPRKTFVWKWGQLFSWNFATDWMCLPSLTAPQVNLCITYEGGVEFPIEPEIICRRGFLSRTTQILMISRLFCRERLRNVHSFKCTCWAIVLLIKSSVLLRPRFRRYRGFLKIPISIE